MRRCIFIDDSAIILRVAARILNGPDLIVIPVTSASDGLAMCAAEMPDVIVLDADLPDMSTEDFLDALKTLETPLAPRIMLCMIKFDLGIYMRARRRGVHSYLLKPFNRAQLLDSFRTFQSEAAA